MVRCARGVHSLLYFAYTCVQNLFIGGLFILQKRLEGDGILHVNMFHYFKIPYFTCTFSTKFTYNEYIGLYFLLHVVVRFFASDLPEMVCCR
jgi:hypothetical protein